MFTSLIEPQQELLHLPDDRTLSLSVSPHPLGGLIFVYEDVTDRLALERSYNTLIEVQRETLDNLYEGIAVFGSDGRLKLYNPAYRTMWGLEPRPTSPASRISARSSRRPAASYDDGGDWPALKRADHRADHRRGASASDRSIAATARCCSWPPCRCPTATCC